MTQYNSICPIFPSMDFEVTKAWYAHLGFAVIQEFPDFGYLILGRDAVELHFHKSGPRDPATSSFAAYVRVTDARALTAAHARLDLPAEGIPRLTPAEDKPWGTCELASVDPDGTLLRIGHNLG